MDYLYSQADNEMDEGFEDAIPTAMAISEDIETFSTGVIPEDEENLGAEEGEEDEDDDNDDEPEQSLIVCLESKDYMQIRNTLIVLTKLLPQYPKVQHLAIALDKRVEKIIEEEKKDQPDLFALATGYSGMLKAQKANLVTETEYHNKEGVKAVQDNVGNGIDVKSSASSASRTKQEHGSEKMLVGDEADITGSSNTAIKRSQRPRRQRNTRRQLSRSPRVAAVPANQMTRKDHQQRRAQNLQLLMDPPNQTILLSEHQKQELNHKSQNIVKLRKARKKPDTSSKDHDRTAKTSTDRKRERSSDKDSPLAEAARELKKKKESPSADSPVCDAKSSSAPDTNKEKRVIKIASKSDSATGSTATSSTASSTTAKKLSHSPSTSSNSPNRKVTTTVRKEKEDDKHKKHSKKTSTTTPPSTATTAAKK